MPHQRGQWGKKKIKARTSEKKTRSTSVSDDCASSSASALTAHLPSLRFLFSSSLPPSSLGISKLGEDDADVDVKEDGRRLQPPGEGRFLSLSLSLSLSPIFHFPFPILRFSFLFPISYSLFALYLGYFHSSLPGDFLLNVVIILISKTRSRRGEGRPASHWLLQKLQTVAVQFIQDRRLLKSDYELNLFLY